MTDYKISQLTQATPASADLIPFVDVDDTSTPPAGSGGSDKAVTLAGLRGLRVFRIDDYGADPSGASLSDSAWTAAYAAATSAVIAGPPGGGAIVMFGAGLYKFSLNVVKTSNAAIGIVGPGSQACTLTSSGSSGDLVWATDTTGAAPGAAPVGGFSLYGWNTGAGTNGLHFGDRSASRLYDVVAYGFNGDGTCRGFWFRNDNGHLCEQNFVQVVSNQNSILYSFDGNNANGSFDYGNYFLGFIQTQITAAAIGVQWVNQAHMYGAHLEVHGNASNSNAGRTITCFKVGSSGTDTARLQNCQGTIAIECDNSTGTVTDIVVQGASSAAGIVQFGGQAKFLNAAGSFTAGSVTSPAVVTGWGTFAGPLFSGHGTLTALGTAAAGLSTYSG